ncbi:MAG: GAF domain-containing protein [Candidatus Omnitrophica bacterium]|nr:GAF domain-containing protein [Candidatus Omnitrophota bacterium]
MSSKNPENIHIEEFIDKQKWTELLKRFADVLRINVLLTNPQGRILATPSGEGDLPQERYGGEFLTTSFKLDFSGQNSSFLKNFQPYDSYLEIKDFFDLYVFTIPCKMENEIIAYLLVGPVILNKRQDSEVYLKTANQFSVDLPHLSEKIHELRIVSFIAIKTILDLLAEVIKDLLQLGVEKKRLHEKRFQKEILSKEMAETAQDLYTTIHLDELLITALDIASQLTGAEYGSIMLLDELQQELSIKVSKGMEKSISQNVKIKIGERIAGLAAQENRTFILSKEPSEERLKKYFEKPEIQQAIVMPLSTEGRVVGVLNLHTKKENQNLEANLHHLKHISELVSTAIHNI